MKFTIIIPTQDRSHLLAAVVEYALRLKHSDFEVIVSDNSTTIERVQLNKNAVSNYINASNFKIIRPPKVLSPPEHFEFALNAVTLGDYVIYLTDKMIILPHALSEIERAINQTDADIVNWGYATYFLDDVNNPLSSGTLVKETTLMQGVFEVYDAEKALAFKANGVTPRNKQMVHDYVLGKIVFGCYRRSLIENVLRVSGTLFGGATHDYSAMIQALSLAKNCVMLNDSNFIFFSLPSDKSLGSMTEINSQAALKYFHSFRNADEILSNLLIPGVYASQHNMVAHDYMKFLPLYGNERYFNIMNWLLAIYSDLVSPAKIWKNNEERLSQLNLFFEFVEASGQKRNFMKRWELAQHRSRQKRLKVLTDAMMARIPNFLRNFFDKSTKPLYSSFVAGTLQEAIQDLEESAVVSSMTRRDGDNQSDGLRNC